MGTTIMLDYLLLVCASRISTKEEDISTFTLNIGVLDPQMITGMPRMVHHLLVNINKVTFFK